MFLLKSDSLQMGINEMIMVLFLKNSLGMKKCCGVQHSLSYANTGRDIN